MSKVKPNKQSKPVDKLNVVSDEVLKQMITDLLDGGNNGATNFYELLRTKIRVGKDRVLKMYPIVELEYINFKNKIIADQRAADISQAAREGLKSDLELEQILCQIASNNCEVEEWIKGEKVLRGVSPMEVIAAVGAIYKKRGSNAPTKTAATNSKGEDVPPMSDIQLAQMVAEIQKANGIS